MTIQATSSMAPLSPETVHRSPWHSPVPYLFGGLAAMLGLIVFALLILACSCCKKITLNEQDLESGIDDENRDPKPVNHKEPLVFEDKCLVIMAGHVNPTFLAAPVSSRGSSVGSCSSRSDSMASTDTLSVCEEEKDKSSDQIQVRNIEDHEIACELH